MVRRRGFILPIVLVLVGMLALIMAGYMFFVRAEMAGVRAQRDVQQAGLTAESGLEEVLLLLRESPEDSTAWTDVPATFRHVLVWSDSFTREDDPLNSASTRADLLEEGATWTAWRYSVVAPDMTEDRAREVFRYGITPEAGKLNINTAEEAEIERLATPLLLDLGIENTGEVLAALFDWMDEDDDARQGGAESDDYYTLLKPGYYAKNGRLDTIEELLLVKGFSAAILYGEDVNRNGLLDLNEDDGDESFPYYDNGDGELNRGIAPFLTVWSREPGQVEGQEGQQMVEGKININTASARVLAALEGMSEEAASQIVAARAEMEGEALADASWVQTVIDPLSYEAIQDRITARALQFHVEILAYGDHTRLARRYEWVIEMRGELAQVLYHRDLTALGFAWPVNDDDFLVQGK